MRIRAIVHEAEEGGYWAEVPTIPGCVTQAETMDELLANLREAVTACLEVEIPEVELADRDTVVEIAV